eukprot:CAMPEP_0177578744 /NCGR_PEP_ID=MMETSP0419_2-20121207/527_1 /TAXON_ID=582737 /ORGANISM="Tetraselmis sp., Strain GSL018" /LENGTH=65 /DNA_ID=CAMNT_0019067239 /DNA_START=1164 /DNA_END=1358 /DNA_ORIENTATION=-
MAIEFEDIRKLVSRLSVEPESASLKLRDVLASNRLFSDALRLSDKFLVSELSELLGSSIFPAESK